MQLRRPVIGWIAAAAFLSAPLRARATVVEPLAPPSGAAPSAASVGSLTYVKSLDHLVELTRDDNLLHPRAVTLARQTKIGMGVMMGGMAVGALIVVGAATVFQQNECTMPSVPAGFDLPVSPICQDHTNVPMLTAGLVTSAVGWLTGLMLLPRQTEWYDIINEWNARHPDRSLLLVPSKD